MQSNVRGVISNSLLHANVRLSLDVRLIRAFLSIAVNGLCCLATDSLPSTVAEKIVPMRREQHSLSGRCCWGLAGRSRGLAHCCSLGTFSLSWSSNLLGDSLGAVDGISMQQQYSMHNRHSRLSTSASSNTGAGSTSGHGDRWGSGEVERER